MDEKIQNVTTMSPTRLLVGFTRGRIIVWSGIAIVIHVVLIAVFSMAYIRDRWIDPEGAVARKAAAQAAEEALKKEAAAKAAPPATGTVAKASAATGTVAATTGAVAQVATSAATTAVAAASSAATGAGAGEPTLDDRKNAPVVKRITEKAQPGEIPTQPDDLGISIGDTSIH